MTTPENCAEILRVQNVKPAQNDRQDDFTDPKRDRNISVDRRPGNRIYN